VVENKRLGRHLWLGGVFGLCLAAGVAQYALSTQEATGASWPWHRSGDCQTSVCEHEPAVDELGGSWYWMRSPDEEKRVAAGLYNRYCIRCHGVDGRGVWDIPGVPDFTNTRWQASRSDGQRARIILEGRGAVMPPFRGALSLEEAWALGRYLHTFVPGTEVSRPDLRKPATPETPMPPKKPEAPVK
jgi:hypothetical protein